MKTRKTPQSERKTYSYFCEDAEGNIQEVSIRSGENGVTKEHIDMLHSMDDMEIYNNSKNEQPPLTKKEKECLREWRKRNPGADTPARVNISLDKCFDDCYSKESSKVLAETAINDTDLFPEIIMLREIIKKLPQLDKEIYEFVMLGGMKYSEAAAHFKLSQKSIEYHVNKIRKYIKTEFEK